MRINEFKKELQDLMDKYQAEISMYEGQLFATIDDSSIPEIFEEDDYDEKLITFDYSIKHQRG